MPTVSIIMPCKNERRYLFRSLDSLERQTYQDWELIVVDDGSTDGSQDYVRERAARDGRIRLVDNWLNHGVSNALNAGITNSSGIYIARLDADDESAPERLQLMVDYLERHPEVGVVGCGVVKRYWFDGRVAKEEIFTYRDDARILLDSLAKMVAIGANSMIRRDVFERIGGYNPCLGAEEELDLLIRAATVAELGYVEKPLYIYNLITEKARSLGGRRFHKKWVMARLNCRAIGQLKLSKSLYIYPLAWLVYSFIPAGLRNLARRRYYVVKN